MTRFLLTVVMATLLLTVPASALGDSFFGFPIEQSTVSGQGYRVDSEWQDWDFVGIGTVGAVAFDADGDTVYNAYSTHSVTLIAPGSGVTFECASSSVQDSADIVGTAGTGAWTVKAFFIDDAGYLQVETFVMDGTTVEVTTGTDYIACIGAYVVTVGTGGTSAGNIYIAADDTWTSGVPQTATKIWCKLPTGDAVSQNAFGYVPRGMSGRISDLEFSNNACGGYASYYLWIKEWGKAKKLVKKWDVNDQEDVQNFDFYLPEKCFWEFAGVNSTGTTEVKVNGKLKLK